MLSLLGVSFVSFQKNWNNSCVIESIACISTLKWFVLNQRNLFISIRFFHHCFLNEWYNKKYLNPRKLSRISKIGRKNVAVNLIFLCRQHFFVRKFLSSTETMKDSKKVNEFLEQLNVTLASDMDRILDHFSNGDIQEEDLRTFIHQNVRFM